MIKLSLISISILVISTLTGCSTNDHYKNKYNASQKLSLENCHSITQGHKNDNTGKTLITKCD